MVGVLIGNVLAIIAYWFLPRFWAKADYKAIQVDGAKDSLHEEFHVFRAIVRGWMMALLAVFGAAAWALQGKDTSFYLQVGGLFVLGTCYFAYNFNPRLSELRGLDPWYVSADPRASYFDRFLYARGWPLRTVLRVTLGAGILVYLAATAAAMGAAT